MGMLSLLFVVVASARGFYRVFTLSAASQQNLKYVSATRHQMQADMMHDALRADALEALHAAPREDVNEEEAVRKALKEHVAGFHDNLNALAKIELDLETKQAIAHVRPALDRYIAAPNCETDLAFTGLTAAEGGYPQFVAAFDHLAEAMGSFSELISKRAHAAEADAASTSKRVQTVVVATLPISFPILAILGLTTTRSSFAPCASLSKSFSAFPWAISRRASTWLARTRQGKCWSRSRA